MLVRIIKLELNEAFRTLHNSRRLILQLMRQIASRVPCYICDDFFRRQEISLNEFWRKEVSKMDKKMSWLILKRNKERSENIKPINYSYIYTKNENNKEECLSISFKPAIQLNKHTEVINIKPHTFVEEDNSSLNNVRDKWLINWSKIDIPHNIKCLLQLGQNFAMPATDIKKNIIELIKNIENNINKLNIDIQSLIRNNSLPIIKKLFNRCSQKNKMHERLLSVGRLTRQFIKKHPKLVLTRADKGNVTVALNREDYICKIETMLQDQDTYTNVTNNPIKKITNEARNLLTRWRKNNYVTSELYNKIYCSDGILPRVYGVPKVHKKDNSYRIIISSIDSPLYPLANFIHEIIKNNCPKAESHIENSFQLVKKLRGFNLEEGVDLISLDAVSLFTNIPVELMIESINNRWTHISKGCSIPKEEFLNALKLIIDSTYFSFNDKFYRQKFGTPMGSPLSPIIADVVLQDLEKRAMDRLGIEVPFYMRYVDDIATAVHHTQHNKLLNIFNSFHPRLQFTMENGGKRLDFLDVTIINNNDKIEFDWFHKPTFSGRYLNFLSAHPLSQKRGALIGMIDRAFLLAHPKYHEKNFRFIINTFKSNDYPVEFIFNTINSRVRTLIKGRTDIPIKRVDDNKEKTQWFTVPYFPNISEKFNNFIKGSNIKLSFFSLNKLERIIRVQKDRIADLSKKNVVYRISCNDCDATYVGQTKRKLSTRITEHRNQINHKTTKLSVISEHRLNHNHEIDWMNVKILDNERFYWKRIISEMVNIQLQNNALNQQTDTEYLHNTYTSILNRL